MPKSYKTKVIRLIHVSYMYPLKIGQYTVPVKDVIIRMNVSLEPFYSVYHPVCKHSLSHSICLVKLCDYRRVDRKVSQTQNTRGLAQCLANHGVSRVIVDALSKV